MLRPYDCGVAGHVYYGHGRLHGWDVKKRKRAMRTAQIDFRFVSVCAIFALMLVGVNGCGSTTIIHQTVVVDATVSPSTAPAATATSTAVPKPPPGIWCLVKQGQTPLLPACEIFPSGPKLYTPPQSETVLAGKYVGPGIGNGGSNSVTEYMVSPWAADVDCSTSDNSSTGKVRIVMVAHTSNGDFYSWGNESCGPPEAPSYGHEFYRKATVTVTLSILPLTSNLFDWRAQLIQL
jgi:hypothetical protein